MSHASPIPQHLPAAATLRRLIEALDRRLLGLFEDGDEPDDATILGIANVESARNAALRLLAEAEAREIAAAG